LESSFPRERITAEDRSFGDLVARVSENVSLLVREEIELAKAEMEQKAKRIARGAAAAAVSGFFVLLGLIFLLESAAWGLADVLNEPFAWIGFLIVAGALFVLAVAGAIFALRSIKAGSPPTPDQAIEEARLIREALEHPEVQAASTTSAAKKED